MATEIATPQLDEGLFNDISKAVKIKNKKDRTEFLRRVIGKKVEDPQLRESMVQVALLIGASKKKTTEEEYERARQEAAEELTGRLRSNPRV